jgi:hypothetical protein
VARQDDHRRRIRLLPDAKQDVFTSTVGQHQVEHDTRERVARSISSAAARVLTKSVAKPRPLQLLAFPWVRSFSKRDIGFLPMLLHYRSNLTTA